MCGIVGVKLKNVTEEDIETVRNIFLETEIRGKHASGIAWFDGNGLKHKKSPVPISKFMEGFDLHQCIWGDRNLTLIGHIRYSTSDIKYNQPIGNEDRSFIVHNGVVTQSDPEFWKERYGYECETRNDTELLFHCLEEGCEIESKFPRASYALLRLTQDGEIIFGRNGLRPMWKATLSNGTVFSSTRDILFRAGVPVNTLKKVPAENDKQHRTL